MGEGGEDAVEGGEVLVGGGGEGGFDGVVAGDDGGVVVAHQAGDLGEGLGLAGEAVGPVFNDNYSSQPASDDD